MLGELVSSLRPDNPFLRPAFDQGYMLYCYPLKPASFRVSVPLTALLYHVPTFTFSSVFHHDEIYRLVVVSLLAARRRTTGTDLPTRRFDGLRLTREHMLLLSATTRVFSRLSAI